MSGWLASLDAETLSCLRDDATPVFKERSMRDDEDAAAQPMEPIDSAALEAAGADVREALVDAARVHLPPWQFEAFKLWLAGVNRSRIARQLGVSRATVRCALDGGGTREEAGALKTLAQTPEIRKVVLMAAEKNATKQAARNDERVLHWFRGIDTKPDLIAPLAFLLVLDALVDAKGEVSIGDVLTHFPRSAVTPCLKLLRAHGFAASNGHTIKIHRRPEKKA